MKKICALLMLLLLGANVACAEEFDARTVVGPSIEKLCMVIVANADAQVLAAEKGELDLLSDLARPSDIDRLSADPKLHMALSRGFHAFFLLLNTTCEPWNDKVVRAAVAQAVDRNSIVRGIYSGYCEPINSWLPPVSPWAASDSTRNIFDRDAARKKLISAGYRYDLLGRLQSPDGKPLPKMKLLAPLARVAPTTAELAERLADALVAVGFDVEVEPMDFSAMVARLDRKDYSLAVLAWSMGRNPDSLYSFYHSEMDVPGGYNLTGIHDAQLDEALSRLRTAPDKAAAEKASADAQRLLSDLVPSVPIYSRFSISAISKRWDIPRLSTDDMWTLLTARPREAGQDTFTMALAEEPRTLNPFTASSAYAWQVLGTICEGLLSSDPVTLEDIPGLAERWSVDTLGEGPSCRTVLRFTLREGLRWNDGTPLTASDVAATIDFIRENKIPRFFDSVKDVAKVEFSGERELTVTMSNVSYWHLDRIAGLPCMPRSYLEKITDWQNWDPLDRSETFGPYGLIGAGPFRLLEYRQGEYVMMERNPWYFRLQRKEADS